MVAPMATRMGRGKLALLGLILATGVVVAVVSTADHAVRRTQTPQGAPGYMPIAATGSEQWTVGGQSIHVSSSYHLVMPRADGTPAAMFVAEVIGLGESLTGADVERRGDAIALPIMQHIVREGLHRRVAVQPVDGSPALPLEWIGVVIMIDVGAFSNSGYRTRMTLAEVEASMSPLR